MRDKLTLALSTAILFSTTLPPLKLGVGAYWALVPFFFLLREAELKDGVMWGWLTGLLVGIAALPVGAFMNLAEAGSALAIRAGFFALYAAGHLVVQRRWPGLSAIALAGVWVGLELVEQMSGLSWGWSGLGESHWHYLSLAGRVGGLGTFLISGWLVAVNIAVYRVLIHLPERRNLIRRLAAVLVLCSLPALFAHLGSPRTPAREEGPVAWRSGEQ